MINIKQLMFDKSLSQRKMAEIMNTTQSEVSQIGNGNRRMLRKHIDGLIEYFGEDVINQYTVPDEPLKPITQSATVTILNPDIIEEAKEMGRQEVLNGHSHCVAKPDAICPRGDVARRIPFVSKEIASSPNYDIRKLVREGSPLLDLFPLFKMINGVDYVQTVITMAMAPRYMPGDYLFIAFDEGKVHSGKLYLVDTKTYGTVLRHVYKDNVKGGYRLTARNPEFADVFVSFEDVYSVNSVLLHVNTNTSLTSEVNLAEEVRKRDQQIKELTSSQGNLIDAQRQVLVNQAKLMEQLEKQNERMERIQKRNEDLVDKIINKE
ncbi:MAG: hypothetical protein J6C56_04740 [Alistipes sp.]|nr:hypothetical protein [Alistipes sp.]